MHEFLIIIQIAAIALLVFEIIFVLCQNVSRLQTIMLVMTTSALIMFIGYLFELTATDADAMLVGVKIGYMGKPISILSTFLFVTVTSRIKIPKWLIVILVAVSLVTTALVFTCELHPLYYNSIDYTTEGFFPHLKLGHGVFYYVYTALLLGYFIANTVLGIRRFIKAKTKTERQQSLYIFGLIAGALGGFLTFLSGITHGYDTTIFGSLIGMIFLFILFHKYHIFDTLTLGKEQALDDYSDGFIVVDSNGDFVYANAVANRLFNKITASNTAQTVERLERCFNTDKVMFAEGKVYGLNVQPIVKRDVVYGKTYEIHDVTDSYYYASRLEYEVKERTEQIRHIQRSVVASFANLVEARDGVTGEHIKNTSQSVKIILTAMKNKGLNADVLTDEFIAVATDVAPLHDIGKIVVSDVILRKPGKLTPEEYEIIKTHSQTGADIIENNLKGVESDEYVRVAKNIALFHHEKWDGSGYPKGLKHQEIPLEARVMAIADVYDALRTKRSYKDIFSREESCKIIRESRGEHFDPVVTDVFFECVDEIEMVKSESVSNA